MYICSPTLRCRKARRCRKKGRRRLNGYVLSPIGYLVFFPASSSRDCLNRAVLERIFPWRARYPLS